MLWAVSVCVCVGVMFDWPGSCLLALLVDVMAIKLVVSFWEGGGVRGYESKLC